MRANISSLRRVQFLLAGAVFLLIWTGWNLWNSRQEPTPKPAITETEIDESQTEVVDLGQSPKTVKSEIQISADFLNESLLEEIDDMCPNMDQVIREIDPECTSALNRHFLDTALGPKEFVAVNIYEICKSRQERHGSESFSCAHQARAFHRAHELTRLAIKNPPTYRDIFNDPMSDRELTFAAVFNFGCRRFSTKSDLQELYQSCHGDAMLRYVSFVEACVHHRKRLYSHRAWQERNPQGISRYANLLNEMDSLTWPAGRHQRMRDWLREDIYRDAWATKVCDGYPDEKIRLSDIVEPLGLDDEYKRTLKRVIAFNSGTNPNDIDQPYVGNQLPASEQILSLAYRRGITQHESQRMWRMLARLGNQWAMSRLEEEVTPGLVKYRREKWPLMDALARLFTYRRGDQEDELDREKGVSVVWRSNEDWLDREAGERLFAEAKSLARAKGMELDWDTIDRYFDRAEPLRIFIDDRSAIPPLVPFLPALNEQNH